VIFRCGSHRGIQNALEPFLERPALKRLIADIEAGQIDVVVVYKADRLTRALSDFAKLVDVFDRRGVSFVSITQQFNTTTSMGRLTLNVLLSSRRRPLCIPCSADELAGARGFSRPCDCPLASRHQASKRAGSGPHGSE
jgi:hypothetical protein